MFLTFPLPLFDYHLSSSRTEREKNNMTNSNADLAFLEISSECLVFGITLSMLLILLHRRIPTFASVFWTIFIISFVNGYLWFGLPFATRTRVWFSLKSVLLVWSIWKCSNSDAGNLRPQILPAGFDWKRDPRYCLRCKVSRAQYVHHCHLCKRCVLGRDHHCIPMQNCVGQKNRKYFILTLFYANLCAVSAMNHLRNFAQSRIDSPGMMLLSKQAHYVIINNNPISSYIYVWSIGFMYKAVVIVTILFALFVAMLVSTLLMNQLFFISVGVGQLHKDALDRVSQKQKFLAVGTLLVAVLCFWDKSCKVVTLRQRWMNIFGWSYSRFLFWFLPL